jgi:TetR/AcrR family acrAB operon transcriptional repressor
VARKSKEETAKTRIAIIEAARGVFHLHGVSRSTLGQIAAEAGVTRGAVYYHSSARGMAKARSVNGPLGFMTLPSGVP